MSLYSETRDNVLSIKNKTALEGRDGNLLAINETLSYYKELYTILSTQTLRQIYVSNAVDYQIVGYMFDILKKLNGGVRPDITFDDYNVRYVLVKVFMTSMRLTENNSPTCFLLLRATFVSCCVSR